jgi:hypothetical protein
MVPWPLYCASLALSLSPVGNAPADTTNIETTTATPAARDTADRADFSRTMSLPPRNPYSPNSQQTSRAALPHRISSCPATSVHPLQRLNRTGSRPHRVIMPTFPSTRQLASQHAPACGLRLSACSSLRLSLVSTSACQLYSSWVTLRRVRATLGVFPSLARCPTTQLKC